VLLLVPHLQSHPSDWSHIKSLGQVHKNRPPSKSTCVPNLALPVHLELVPTEAYQPGPLLFSPLFQTRGIHSQPAFL
jgi:hypothetical protein